MYTYNVQHEIPPNMFRSNYDPKFTHTKFKTWYQTCRTMIDTVSLRNWSIQMKFRNTRYIGDASTLNWTNLPCISSRYWTLLRNDKVESRLQMLHMCRACNQHSLYSQKFVTRTIAQHERSYTKFNSFAPFSLNIINFYENPLKSSVNSFKSLQVFYLHP